jgi:hypothetical protein
MHIFLKKLIYVLLPPQIVNLYKDTDLQSIVNEAVYFLLLKNNNNAMLLINTKNS